jgi:hypothetical protein
LSIEKAIKEHCNTCLGWKNHSVVHQEVSNWTDVIDELDGVSINGGHRWTLYKCLGCDDIRLKHTHWFSEDYDENGQPTIYAEWFPPSITRQKPKWMQSFFPFNANLIELRGMLIEIYGSLAIGAHRLATMGIRALAERVMIEIVGDKGTFQLTVREFLEKGYVAAVQRPMFESTLIEAGHAATHRGFSPSAADVNTLLDIIESITNTIYYQPLLAADMRKSIPERVGTKK